MTTIAESLQGKSVVQVLRIIYEDLIDRGMKEEDLPEVERDLSSNFSYLVPADQDIIEMFRKGYDTGWYDNQSLFDIKYDFSTDIQVVEDDNDGNGNQCRKVIKYVFKDNSFVYIKYEGTYSSWDNNTWDYMGYCFTHTERIVYDYHMLEHISI